MDKMLFMRLFEDLCVNFKEPFKQVRADLYFAKLQHLSNSQFEAIADKIIRTETKGIFPTVGAMLAHQRSLPEEPINPAKVVLCGMCDSTGRLYAYDLSGYKVPFRCPQCLAGESHLTVWQDAFSKQGYCLVPKISWNAIDQKILKGLFVLGSKSRAWKLAPEAVKRAALELYPNFARTISSSRDGTAVADALKSQPDSTVEDGRRRSLAIDHARENRM